LKNASSTDAIKRLIGWIFREKLATAGIPTILAVPKGCEVRQLEIRVVFKEFGVGTVYGPAE
jgi:hypothetical protein